LTFFLTTKGLNLIFQQNQREGDRIFVINGAPSVKLVIPFHRHKKFLRGVHHVQMGHEQNRCKIAFRAGDNGWHTFLVNTPVGYARIFQKILNKGHTCLDLIRLGVHGLKANKLFGQLNDLIHGRLTLS